MSAALRSVVALAAVAVALMAILDLWIRAKPFDMARATQIVLTIALLVAIAVLLWLVHRVERTDAGS
jgi:uncharacterized membrane-anchored protein